MQRACVGKALGWFSMKTSCNERFVFALKRAEIRSRRFDEIHCLQRRVAIERATTTEHLHEGDAETKLIALRSEFERRDLFGAHVGIFPLPDVALCAVCELCSLGDTKVGELDLTRGRDEDV